MPSPLFTRRSLIQLAAAAGTVPRLARSAERVSLFDGKSLNGWAQIENNATSFSSGAITDFPAFAARLAKGSDPISDYLRTRFDAALLSDLAVFTPDAPDVKAVTSALIKALNAIVSGPAIYDRARFAGVDLRPETARLIDSHPAGYALARLNKLLIEDAYTKEVALSRMDGWTVKDGAMAGLGTGRGVIYTDGDYSRFRLAFTMRHISGNPDHAACVLIFCTRPHADEKPLDALGGIQFQVPNGGHWDYRPGRNNAGNEEFTKINTARFDAHEWSRVEILADSSKGEARMWVAQPLDSAAVEVLAFRDPAAGKPGPIALQMHNAGLLDEYKDLSVERNPA